MTRNFLILLWAMAILGVSEARAQDFIDPAFDNAHLETNYPIQEREAEGPTLTGSPALQGSLLMMTGLVGSMGSMMVYVAEDITTPSAHYRTVPEAVRGPANGGLPQHRNALVLYRDLRSREVQEFTVPTRNLRPFLEELERSGAAGSVTISRLGIGRVPRVALIASFSALGLGFIRWFSADISHTEAIRRPHGSTQHAPQE